MQNNFQLNPLKIINAKKILFLFLLSFKLFEGNSGFVLLLLLFYILYNFYLSSLLIFKETKGTVIQPIPRLNCLSLLNV